MERIGSFIITEKTGPLGNIYTVTYSDEHKKNLYWQFINDKEEAIAFAEKKSVQERKFYRRKQ